MLARARSGALLAGALCTFSDGDVERGLAEPSEAGGSSSALDVCGSSELVSSETTSFASASSIIASPRSMVENLDGSSTSWSSAGDASGEGLCAGDAKGMAPTSSSLSYDNPIFAARSSASNCTSSHPGFKGVLAAKSRRRSSDVKWTPETGSSLSEKASSISRDILAS